MQQSIRADADQLLKDIGQVTARLTAVEAEAEAEIEAVRAHYAKRADPTRDRLKALDKALLTLMKSRQVPLFDGGDTVKLLHGILLYNKEDKVSIPRDALLKIKTLGWFKVILIAESVNRAMVEKWPDEKLVMIGAKRKEKKSYSYELTIANQKIHPTERGG